MEQPIVRVGCAILLLYAAVLTSMGPVQAGPRTQDAHPDSAWEAAQAATPETTDQARPPPVEPDDVLLAVTVYENGTAQWRIEYRTLLEDRHTRDAFRRLRRDLENGSTAHAQEFYSRIRASIAAAENATGREMNGAGFAASADVRRLPRKYGVVVYRFRWDGFASVSDRRIHVGDALRGFFLGEDERLLLSWPRGYELTEIRPRPDVQRDHTVAWQGPREFGPEEPRVLVTERVWPWRGFLGIGAAAGVLAVAVLVVWRRRGDVVPPPVAGLFDRREDGSELLSNEERVVELLERRGGRVKQQVIADELGWTETKTSYVVSKLRDDGRIDSFRLGRENVLSLTDRDADERRA